MRCENDLEGEVEISSSECFSTKMTEALIRGQTGKYKGAPEPL